LNLEVGNNIVELFKLGRKVELPDVCGASLADQVLFALQKAKDLQT